MVTGAPELTDTQIRFAEVVGAMLAELWDQEHQRPEEQQRPKN